MDSFQRQKQLEISKLHETSLTTVVATADGTGTAVIPATAEILIGVGVEGQANYWITLPDPTTCPNGHEIWIQTVNACELRTSAPGTIALNGVTGSGKELALAAGSITLVKKISNTAWAAIPASGTPD